MRKIGIISDTHGMLRKEVLDALQGCELIFHCGDINERRILTELGQIAPVYAVRGNNDKDWAADLPESLKTKVGKLCLFMVHNKKYIPENLLGIQLVIYGHSHKYEEKERNGVRYLNPGSCGPRRFHQDITLSIMWLEEEGSFNIEKIIIPHKEKKENPDKNLTTPAIGEMIPEIMSEIDTGKTVSQIAAKHQISELLAEQIMRMYFTHPGIDVDGILKRIGF